ncbi:NAD(+) synthase [uncultured Desulfuromusa sp.]|uniref:NAD(+) synthase n=1 Tax=uncultured Desulfuromusa sp. TaxID=219183 RepID=UPI002AA9209E|nr:NAD(+) synthase [uncultured Desulfuromusa sp.]
MTKPAFTKDILELDAEQEVERITSKLRNLMKNTIKRRGIVLGLSGGIDSSVTCALAVKAFGPKKVFGLHMPERHSSDETLSLSTSVSDHFGIESAHENISGILEAVGFYQRYDAAVQSVIPEYGEGWKSKIVIPNVIESTEFSLFSVVVQSPDGEIQKVRLPLKAYLEILAATNFKQRTRKMLEYYHADRLNFAVAGTPNRLEYDQGFFVKLGDGAADVKPIAHLYKTQVYQLAEYLGVPTDIRKRPPTTDTYSLPQGQDEFYFSLPHDRMDLCLYGKNNGYSTAEVGEVLELTPEQVQRVYDDIDTKRSTTRYLHLHGLLVGDVPEIK